MLDSGAFQAGSLRETFEAESGNAGEGVFSIVALRHFNPDAILKK